MNAATITMDGQHAPGRSGSLMDVLRDVGELVGAFVDFTAFLTNTGVGMFIDWADGTIASPHTEYLNWGTSATAAAKTDTDLGAVSSEARISTSGLRTQITVTNTGDTFQWTGTQIASAGTPKTIKEVALFSASSAGTCIIHANHTDAVMTSSGDKVDYTITLQLTN